MSSNVTDTDRQVLDQLTEKHGYPGPWITTFSGYHFPFLAPHIYLNDTPEADILLDITTALSKEPRFGGHNQGIWSVAAHSIFVHKLIQQRYPGTGRDLLLGALLHDIHEAYLKDIMRPLKLLFGPEYKALAHLIQSAFHDRFGVYLDLDEEDAIARADIAVLKTEAAAMMRNYEDWTFEEYRDSISGLEYLHSEPPAPTNLFPIKDYHPSDIAQLFLKELQEYIP